MRLAALLHWRHHVPIPPYSRVIPPKSDDFPRNCPPIAPKPKPPDRERPNRTPAGRLKPRLNSQTARRRPASTEHGRRTGPNRRRPAKLIWRAQRGRRADRTARHRTRRKTAGPTTGPKRRRTGDGGNGPRNGPTSAEAQRKRPPPNTSTRGAEKDEIIPQTTTRRRLTPHSAKCGERQRIGNRTPAHQQRGNIRARIADAPARRPAPAHRRADRTDRAPVQQQTTRAHERNATC